MCINISHHKYFKKFSYLKTITMKQQKSIFKQTNKKAMKYITNCIKSTLEKCFANVTTYFCVKFKPKY